MRQFKVGDQIEHQLMPGFTMTVLDVRGCETDSGRPELHDAYKVTDPEGDEDWLCAYDVQAAAVPLLPGERRAANGVIIGSGAMPDVPRYGADENFGLYGSGAHPFPAGTP